MCGIFGYVGSRSDASQIILDGLKLLEYRGYDSWGVSSKKNKKFVVEKYVGKIGNAKLKKNIKSSLGIGHTRWATHGGVSVRNAHPHLDCTKEISVVHNGIVENFEELRKDLVKKGHKFVSQTDTEVIPHLIEEFSKNEGFTSAVRDSFNKLRGLNAIVVANAKSSEIVAAKNGSPLIVGIGQNEFHIASDVTAISSKVRRSIFLKDNEMVVLGKHMQLLSLPNGRKLKPSIEKIVFKHRESNKGNYKHFMLKEIFEQPKVIENIARNYVSQIKNLNKIFKKAKGTFFIGAGTAFYAALAGTYLFSKIAHKHVNTSVASEFNYLEDFLTKESLVIALSQSGETIDVIEPLNRAKKKGSKIVAITNALGSSIYRVADNNILLNAGIEKAVASTKAYTAKLCVILMLIFISLNKEKEAKNLLTLAAKEAERHLVPGKIKLIKKIASIIEKSRSLYAIGRGVSYASALEAGLKIKELTYIPTEGLAGGELKHGTIALIEKGTPCIVFAPNDETYNSIISNATEIKSRGGLIIGISYKNSTVFDHWIESRDIKEASFITQIIPVQLLAYYISVIRGYDPDKPRNLAKSVTVK